MRIALVSFGYGDNPAWLNTFGNLSRELARLGHEVVAVIGRAHSGLPLREQSGTATWRRVPRRYWGLSNASFQFLGFARAARAEGCEIVHVHFSGEFRWPVLWMALWCRLSGRRMVLSFNDFDNPSAPPLGWPGRVLLGVALCLSHGVTVNSRYVGDRVRQTFRGLAGEPALVYHGVDSAHYRPREAGPPHFPYVLFTGRLASYKGVDILVMAWRELLDRGHRVRLLLTGPDFNPGHIQGLISLLRLEPWVSYEGVLPRAELDRLLADCLFLALPSRQEALGLSALEAMACGKPVVASRCGGLSEIVRHGYNGLLAQPKDLGSLVEVLDRLLRDDELRRQLGQNALRTAGNFDWRFTASGYHEVYASR
ncbi:MAG: glycosyltransferase family 4 protein [Elusimicrobia bacterium]|nr:glycosyltransferase family 4 protein [Elusimicrobiota bacterium]